MADYYVECKGCKKPVAIPKPASPVWARYVTCRKCDSVRIYTHSDLKLRTDGKDSTER